MKRTLSPSAVRLPRADARHRFASTRATRPPYARMIKIHELIAAGKFPNCSMLADVFEVSYKTVQRDIDFMRDQMLLPIDYDSCQRGFHYTKPVGSFPTVNITQGEVVALLVAQKALEQYQGTAFEKPLRTAFEKMTSALRDEISISLEDLGRAFSFRPLGSAEQDLAVFNVLAEALMSSRTLEFDYHGLKKNKSERRRIEPYHLGCINNQWYLVGLDLQRGKLRTFALTRLSRPKVLKQTFRKPENFSLPEMMKGSFMAFETSETQTVRIRLDDFAARLASERTWHKSQQLKPLPGGGAELTLTVGLAPDLENWILGWGSHAVVLEPESLREQIAATARTMALQYQRQR
ncbi:MAG: WYL domain-containing protein [Chthoniobacterales bacterium]|nr:WYL domain-containing protein [Chthoniobacterales bacterium]